MVDTISKADAKKSSETGLADATAQSEGEKKGFVVTSPNDLIKHLSTEIDTHTKMIFDWRARAAFYWLVGPFLAIGSFVIVTKERPAFHGLDSVGWMALGIACLCFVGMAYLGSRIETDLTDQCNIWRLTIFQLTTQQTPILQETDVVGPKKPVKIAYMVAHTLLLVTFLSTLFLISRSVVAKQNVEPPSNTIQPSIK
jgi:hypothetical protein